MFDDLENDLDLDRATSAVDRREKWPCQQCNGTGRYQGVRVHQTKSACFACNGRGHFLTSPEQRHKNRQQRAAQFERKRDTWVDEHRTLIDGLEACRTWSRFAADMLRTVEQYGQLTPRQVEASEQLLDKVTARQAERKQSESSKPTLDLSNIFTLFKTAQANGLKKPKLHLRPLVISLAPAHGRNAGSLYVKSDGEYAGKITPEGKFFGVTDDRDEIQAQLTEITERPLDALVASGHRTGACACCGRELTNEESVQRGIGPVCATKWGLV